jgi:hypothetical protein
MEAMRKRASGQALSDDIVRRCVCPPPLDSKEPVCVSQALMETSTLVRKGYDMNCLHHDLEVLNNPVPLPSTPSSRRVLTRD